MRSRGVINKDRVGHVRTGRQTGVVDAKLALVRHHEHLSWARPTERTGLSKSGIRAIGRGVATVCPCQPRAVGRLFRSTTVTTAPGEAGIYRSNRLAHLNATRYRHLRTFKRRIGIKGPAIVSSGLLRVR